MTKVSVIVPVYNVEKYLSKCLDSLVNQTLRDLEIICINDGSTDNSLKILRQYASNDSRIIVIDQKNSGTGSARNRGLKVAKGEYIAFADPDDWLELNAFEELYKKAKELNAQILMFDYNIASDKKTKYRCQADVLKEKFNFDLCEKKYLDKNDIKKFFCDISVYVWCKIYQKQFLDEHKIYFPEVYFSEDHFFTWLCLYNAEKIYYMNKSFYYYYMRLTSAVNSYFDPTYSVFDVTISMKKFIYEKMPEFTERIEDLCYYNFVHLYNAMPFYAFFKRRKFLKKYYEYFGKEKYSNLIKKLDESKKPFYREIFSVQNKFYTFKVKEITILGFKFRYEK